MDTSSWQRRLLPSFVVGAGLLAVSAAWDLSAARSLLPFPLTPVAFLLFLTMEVFHSVRRLNRADRAAADLEQSLTQSLVDLREAAEAYSRFVPAPFLRHLKRETIGSVRLGDQVARTMTILFSDIRDFTALSERLTPEENFQFLNGYLGRIGPIIRDQYGFIDKYIGDAIMALFDGPVDEALSAAVAMQLATLEFNQNIRDGRLKPITVGIGLHCGPVMLGIIGEEGRMESTVISDSVNLASRIESLTKHYDCRILVSRSTFEAQSEPQPYLTRPVDLVKVKGRSESVELLEILDERFDPRAALKNELSAHLAEAMMVYRRGDFLGARSLFQSLAYKDPEDRLYAIFRRRIEEFLRLGTPPGWDGTNVFDVK